ncbi:MAG TPA: hypothetical protein VHY91_04840 [Pirellulales bacterium]|jgi:hypothetical protein|nr:hypothetical protein [Pirellulales bacterium]
MTIDEPRGGAAVRLRTDLSPEECWARLDTIAIRCSYFFPWRFLFGRKPLLACRRGDHVVLAARKPYKMPYPYWFYGRILADGTGTLVEGKFTWPRGVVATAAIAYVVWSTLLIVGFVVSDGGVMGKPAKLGMLCVMLFVPAALLWYNVWYHRRMPNTVLPLLETTLEASEG